MSFARNGLFGYLLTARGLELIYAKKLEKEAIKKGGIEYGKEHYPLIIALHLGFLTSLYIESKKKNRFNPIAFIIFLYLQYMRYVIISVLGNRWNTKIIVFPDGDLVTSGIYRFSRHPNYRVVEAEMFTIPLILGAWKTSLIFGILNLFILRKIRIPVEEEALKDPMRKL